MSLIEEFITLDILSKAQIRYLYSNIETKNAHKKLYECKKNELVDIKESSIWLSKGNIRAQDEGRFFYLQDRNLFGDKPGKCPHCKDKIKTVEHLATQCESMLYHDYMILHS